MEAWISFDAGGVGTWWLIVHGLQRRNSREQSMVWGRGGRGGERDGSPRAPAHGIFARFLRSCSPRGDSKAT